MEDLIHPWFPQLTETRAIILSRSLGRITAKFVHSEVLSDHCQQSSVDYVCPGLSTCLMGHTFAPCVLLVGESSALGLNL